MRKSYLVFVMVSQDTISSRCSWLSTYQASAQCPVEPNLPEPRSVQRKLWMERRFRIPSSFSVRWPTDMCFVVRLMDSKSRLHFEETP